MDRETAAHFNENVYNRVVENGLGDNIVQLQCLLQMFLFPAATERNDERPRAGFVF